MNEPELLPPVARDLMLERPLPNSSDAERAILGAIILDNALIWMAIQANLTPELFYVPSNRRVFQAMLGLAEKGSEINPILIAEELKFQGYDAGSVGGLSFLTNLTYGLPHFANVANYTKVLFDKHWKRTLIKLCNVVTSQALEDDEAAEVLVTNAETMILGVASQALRGNKKGRSIDFVHVATDKTEFLETLEKRSKGLSDAVPTGLRPLDAMLEGGGLNPQCLYMVAAKPKAGKTSLVLGWAQAIARRFAEQGVKKAVAAASLEMRRLAVEMRMFSAYTGIPYDTLMRPGMLRGVEKELAFAAIERFFDFPLYINDAVYSVDEYRRACERVVLGEMQAAVLMADYLQLFSTKKGKVANPDNLTGEVTVISRELKHAAVDLNVPLVGISSLNRLGELRQSGSIEYDVEALIILENPDWKPNMTLEERAVLDRKAVWDINARLVYQRNGPTGDIMLKFIRRYMQFVTPKEYEEMMRGSKGSESEASLNDLWNQTGSDEGPFTLR
jgi:replicative DNA helicase